MNEMKARFGIVERSIDIEYVRYRCCFDARKKKKKRKRREKKRDIYPSQYSMNFEKIPQRKTTVELETNKIIIIIPVVFPPYRVL